MGATREAEAAWAEVATCWQQQKRRGNATWGLSWGGGQVRLVDQP